MTTTSSQGTHPTRAPSPREQNLIDDILKLYQLHPADQAHSHYRHDAVFHDPVSIATGLESIKAPFNGMPRLFSELGHGDVRCAGGVGGGDDRGRFEAAVCV